MNLLFGICGSTEFKQSNSVHSKFVVTPSVYCLENVTSYVCGMANIHGVSRHLTWEMVFNSTILDRLNGKLRSLLPPMTQWSVMAFARLHLAFDLCLLIPSRPMK